MGCWRAELKRERDERAQPDGEHEPVKPLLSRHQHGDEHAEHRGDGPCGQHAADMPWVLLRHWEFTHVHILAYSGSKSQAERGLLKAGEAARTTGIMHRESRNIGRPGEVEWHTARVVCTAYEICVACENFSQNLAHIAYLVRNTVMACRPPKFG